MTRPVRSPTQTVTLLSAAIAGLIVIVLGILVRLDVLTAIDTAGIHAVRRAASPALTTVMQAASAIAHGRIAVPVALVSAGLILYRVSRRTAAVYVAACATGELLMLLLKEMVHHHRPVGISPKLTDAGWYSFPSGHTMLAVIIFGLAAFFLTERRPLAVRGVALGVAIGFVVLVGLSRIYLGAHWPSDVIAAACAGFAWSALAVAVERHPRADGQLPVAAPNP